MFERTKLVSGTSANFRSFCPAPRAGRSFTGTRRACARKLAEYDCQVDRVKNFRSVLATTALTAFLAVNAGAEPAGPDYKRSQQEAKANHKLVLLNLRAQIAVHQAAVGGRCFSPPEPADYAVKPRPRRVGFPA
jgi:hypothetical protein